MTAQRHAAPIGPETELMTRPAAAKRAGIGLRQLKRAVADGRVPAFLIGARLRLRWRDVVAWIDSTRIAPRDHTRRRLAELEREGRL